jgi:hypothetical protein
MPWAAGHWLRFDPTIPSTFHARFGRLVARCSVGWEEHDAQEPARASPGLPSPAMQPVISMQENSRGKLCWVARVEAPSIIDEIPRSLAPRAAGWDSRCCKREPTPVVPTLSIVLSLSPRPSLPLSLFQATVSSRFSGPASYSHSRRLPIASNSLRFSFQRSGRFRTTPHSDCPPRTRSISIASSEQAANKQQPCLKARPSRPPTPWLRRPTRLILSVSTENVTATQSC